MIVRITVFGGHFAAFADRDGLLAIGGDGDHDANGVGQLFDLGDHGAAAFLAFVFEGFLRSGGKGM